ncbi:MAG TPA: hypothetical protein VFA45_02815 [Actinomycetes bacterium]|nr:hypothetical protein [Actinomycetes bacterium]
MPDDSVSPGEDPPEAALLRQFRDLATRSDPVPAWVVDAARGSLAWRRIDAELAELTYDMALDAERLATVRGEEGPRALTFEVSRLTIEVEVVSVGDTRRLLGQLVPPQPALVELRHAGGQVAVEADHLGRFSVRGFPAGPMSLLCQMAPEPGPRVVETDWVVV